VPFRRLLINLESRRFPAVTTRLTCGFSLSADPRGRECRTRPAARRRSPPGIKGRESALPASRLPGIRPSGPVASPCAETQIPARSRARMLNVPPVCSPTKSTVRSSRTAFRAQVYPGQRAPV